MAEFKGLEGLPEHIRAALELDAQGLKSPAFDPIDALAGGLSAIPKGLANVLADVGIDVFMGLAQEASQNDEYLKAVFAGPRGMKALGIDASKDLAGQFSNLVDRIPRLELDDITLKQKLTPMDIAQGKQGTLHQMATPDDALDKLFQAYPELRMTAVEPQFGVGSQINVRENRIKLGINEDFKPQRASLAHEVQHAIQDIEGMPRGGTPDPKFWARVKEVLEDELLNVQNDLLDMKDAGYKLDNPEFLEVQFIYDRLKQAYKNIDPNNPGETYLRLAGEVEARDVANRVGMHPVLRRKTQPGSIENRIRKLQGKKPYSIEDLIILQD